jgi:hypothetical protein
MAGGTNDELIRTMKGLHYVVPPLPIVDEQPVELNVDGEDVEVVRAQHALGADPDLDKGEEEEGDEGDIDVPIVSEIEEDDVDTAHPPVDGHHEALAEQVTGAELDVANSWSDSASCALELDVSHVPLPVGEALPSRILQKNTHILLFADGEWDLVRIMNGPAEGDVYMYFIYQLGDRVKLRCLLTTTARI